MKLAPPAPKKRKGEPIESRAQISVPPTRIKKFVLARNPGGRMELPAAIALAAALDVVSQLMVIQAAKQMDPKVRGLKPEHVTRAIRKNAAFDALFPEDMYIINVYPPEPTRKAAPRKRPASGAPGAAAPQKRRQTISADGVKVRKLRVEKREVIDSDEESEDTTSDGEDEE